MAPGRRSSETGRQAPSSSPPRTRSEPLLTPMVARHYARHSDDGARRGQGAAANAVVTRCYGRSGTFHLLLTPVTPVSAPAAGGADSLPRRAARDVASSRSGDVAGTTPFNETGAPAIAIPPARCGTGRRSACGAGRRLRRRGAPAAGRPPARGHGRRPARRGGSAAESAISIAQPALARLGLLGADHPRDACRWYRTAPVRRPPRRGCADPSGTARGTRRRARAVPSCSAACRRRSDRRAAPRTRAPGGRHRGPRARARRPR